jgi:hypothetical protein
MSIRKRNGMVTVLITIILTAISIKLLEGCSPKELLKIFGFQTDLISKEDAATFILQRQVEFVWKPQIVDKPIVTNVVNFDDLKTKKKIKRNKYV